MSPEDRVTDWIGMTYAQRVDACRIFLVVHGFIAPAVGADVKRRMVRRGLLLRDTPIDSASTTGPKEDRP